MKACSRNAQRMQLLCKVLLEMQDSLAVKCSNFRVRKGSNHGSASCYGTLGKSLHLSEPQLLHL